jgi:hypothetical protein
MNNETGTACGMLTATVIIVDPGAPAWPARSFFRKVPAHDANPATYPARNKSALSDDKQLFYN